MYGDHQWNALTLSCTIHILLCSKSAVTPHHPFMNIFQPLLDKPLPRAMGGGCPANRPRPASTAAHTLLVVLTVLAVTVGRVWAQAQPFRPQASVPSPSHPFIFLHLVSPNFV